MLAIKTILHPTDYSEGANQAFQLACSLARDHGARLIVLHVSPPPAATIGGMAAVPPLPDEHEHPADLKKLLSMGSQFPTVALEHRLIEGIPFEEILRVAEETSCDLIVMGTHGRTGLNRLVMGSVAEQVMRKASCPVLTVKLPVAHQPCEACSKTHEPATV